MQFEQREQLLIDRDLKPTNVRVAAKRGNRKLLDFGVARQAPVSSRERMPICLAPAWCLLLAVAVLVVGCGKGRLEVRATGKEGKRGVEVFCEAAGAECMVTVEAIDGERRREIYHQRDDFTIGIVEAAWTKDDAAVDLMICDRQGFPVLLRYDFRESRAEVLKGLPESVVGVLRARYGDRPSEVRDRWGIPRWACAEDDLSVYEYLEKIGKARVLVFRAAR